MENPVASEGKRIDQLDVNMGTTAIKADANLQWIGYRDPRLTVNGLHWFKPEQLLQRLPLRSQGVVREAVYSLAQMPAGGRIRFKTDSGKMVLRLHTPRKAMMNMCPTGHSGADLYMGPPADMHMWQSVRPEYDAFENGLPYDTVLFEDLPESRRIREFTLYLPTYNSITDLQIGIEKNAVIEPPSDFVYAKPIVFYGTSITQSGCSSRPGNGHPAIVGRLLGSDFLNLGFSGNGMGESEVAQLVAEIDASIFVLDYEANAGIERIRENLLPFCQILRAKHPNTPLVLVSRLYVGKVNQYFKCHQEHRSALEFYRSVAQQVNQAYPGTTLVLDGWTLIGPQAAEYAYVDGVHPNDYGFVQIAQGMVPVLRSLLASGA